MFINFDRLWRKLTNDQVLKQQYGQHSPPLNSSATGIKPYLLTGESDYEAFECVCLEASIFGRICPLREPQYWMSNKKCIRYVSVRLRSSDVFSEFRLHITLVT